MREFTHLCTNQWSQWPGLNRRPRPYHGRALPTELHWQKGPVAENVEYGTPRVVGPRKLEGE